MTPVNTERMQSSPQMIDVVEMSGRTAKEMNRQLEKLRRKFKKGDSQITKLLRRQILFTLHPTLARRISVRDRRAKPLSRSDETLGTRGTIECWSL